MGALTLLQKDLLFVQKDTKAWHQSHTKHDIQ